MRKNFLDTQTGGASDSAPEQQDKSQKTDFSPKQLEQIKESTDSQPDASKDLNLSVEEENNAQERVDAIEQGTTKESPEDISADNSTPNKILSEYKEDPEVEAEEEKGTLSRILNEVDKSLYNSEKEMLDEIKGTTLPMSSLTETNFETPKGATIPSASIDSYAYDPEIDKEFDLLGDGTIASNQYTSNKDLNTQENYSKSEDEQLVSFEGVPIKKGTVLPESEKKRLKGEPEDAEPGYYTFKGKRYLKDEDGEWFQIKYTERYRRSGTGEPVRKRVIKRLNSKHSELLEINGFFQFNEKNASEQLLEDFMFGRKNKNIDYSKNKFKKGEEIAISEDLGEVQVVTTRYENFKYGSDQSNELKERTKNRKEKYQSKDDGYYSVKNKNFIKKDGKWYRISKGRDNPTGLITRFMDRFDFGSDMELKEIKYNNVVDIELESVPAKKTAEYLEKKIYDIAQSFEDKVSNFLQKTAQNIFDANVDKLVNDDGFETSPIFEFVDKTAKKLKVDLEDWGFTTAEIERAENQIYQMYGGILNQNVEKERVKFDLSDDFLFRPNPYDLDAARKRVNSTYLVDFKTSYGSKSVDSTPSLYGDSGDFPLNDYEVSLYKGIGYLSENNTFRIPKTPGIYFLGNDYATKVDDGDGGYNWVDSSGKVITDSRKRAMYESSSYDESIANSYLGSVTPIQGISFESNEKMMSSLDISDDYVLQGELEESEPTNIKDLPVYKLIFNNEGLKKFLTESGSSISSEPYFLALKKANESGEDTYSALDFLMDLDGAKKPSNVDLDDIEDYFISFANKMDKEVQSYNDFVEANASLVYFVQNIDKFKAQTRTGSGYDFGDERSNSDDFSQSLDKFGIAAIELLLNNSMSNANKVEKIKELKHQISVWNQNLKNTTEKIDEIRGKGQNISTHMFSRKLQVIQSLGNIGNSKQLDEAIQLWSINRELINLLTYDRGIRVKQDGDLEAGFDYLGSATQEKVKSLQDRQEQFLRNKSVESIKERSEIQSKIDNIDKAIPFLEALYYGETGEFGTVADVFADVPENLELNSLEKAEIEVKIKILYATKKRLLTDLDENTVSSVGFFRTDPSVVVESLAEGGTSLKPYVAALPSGGGFSSKDKFDMMFEQINDRRLLLEQRLNLSGKTVSSAIEIRLDKLKDFFATDMSAAEKEYYQLIYDIRIMTPIYLNNVEATKAEVNGFFNSLMGGIFEMTFPNTSKAAGDLRIGLNLLPGMPTGTTISANIGSSPKEQIRDIAQLTNEMIESKNVEGTLQLTSDASDEFSSLVGWSMKEDGLGDRDFWGNTIGVTLGIITMFYGGSGAMKGAGKLIIGGERLLRGNPKKYESIVRNSVKSWKKSYDAVMSRNKYTKNLVSPAIYYGTNFSATGHMFNKERAGEELTFAAGAMGGLLSQGFVKGLPVIGRNLKGMTKGEYQLWVRSTFGSNSNKVILLLQNGSRMAGWGSAETMQETGEELTHIWEDSDNGKKFFEVMEERFGTIDKATRFVVSTFVMGMCFGWGAESAFGSAKSNLSKDQYEIYEKVVNTVKAQHKSAVTEANKTREQYTQNAVNAANAVESQKVEEKDLNAKEEELDPFKKENNQKKSRRKWHKESNSEEIINELETRSQNDEFVSGTTEENVLEVYNTLTEEQKSQVKNMSKDGKPIKPYLVYQKIYNLGKANSESKSLDKSVDELTSTEESPDVNNLFDPAEEAEIIKEYEKQLSEDVIESRNMDNEMKAIEEGVGEDIESEIKQTVLADNQGEVRYKDEQGNDVTRESAEQQATIEEQIKNYDSLAEENKKILRARAKKKIQEENTEKQRIEKIKEKRGKVKKKTSKEVIKQPTELEIEQKAKQIYLESIEQREKQLLGPRTMEIDSERATLTYNQSKSDDTNSIVYDINDETGLVGQVSGKYNQDGDFVIGDVNSSRSDNFAQESIESLAELVDGDIIISGKSDVGRQMHKDDLVILAPDGNYVLPGKNSQKEGRKAKPGDGIRSFKILATQDGITQNQGPGTNLYNAALEVAAKIIDAGGSVARAVSSARDAYRNSNFYKNLEAEEQVRSMNQIEIAIRQSLNTEEFIQLETTTEQAVSAAVKEFQKTDVYKNADRKEKARLTKEFKANIQARVDERVAIESDQATREEGYKMLEEAKSRKTKFEDKIDIKSEILKLKLKSKNIKEGSKAMQDMKSRIVKYIKENIPTGVKYTASEVKSLVTMVQGAKNFESLEKAFNKVDEMAAKKAGQKLTDARNKLKKRLSPKNLRAEMTRKKGGKRKAKVDAYTVDSVKSYISQLGGMDAVSEMNLDEIKEFNDVLNGIISEGKADFKAAQKLLHSAKRKDQGGIILGYDALALQRKNRNVKSISDLKKHLNTRGNFVIIGGKYYTKTDFKENEAEALAEFKNGEYYKSLDEDQKADALQYFNDVVVDNMISFEGIEGNIDYNADDFGAFYSKSPSDVSKTRAKGRVSRGTNPFLAAMDVYGLLIKAYSGPVVGKRKGNNYLKDFINKNIAEKMPIAFARTQQQTYEISQEHKAKLEEIFGKGSFKKALRKGEEAFRIMLFGGFASVPSQLRAQAGLSKDVLGARENRVPTNDQVVHIYNMARNPSDRARLENQGVDVDAIIQYVENNSNSKLGGELSQYADYLMDFYNTTARDMYEDSYEKYTEGMRFDDVKESTKEKSTPSSNMAQVIQEGTDFFVSDPLNPPGEMEELNSMSEEEALRQVEELNKDRKEELVEETKQEESTDETQEKSKVRYYPTSAEITNDESKKEQSIMDLITSGANSQQVNMSLNPGSFQEKKGTGNLRLDKGATEMFADYNMQNTRYKNFSDITNAVSTLFGNKNLSDVMEENMGSNAFDKLRSSLSDAISGEANMMGQIPLALSFLNSIGVVGTLAFKPQQVAKQATSFMHFWNAGIKYGLKGDNPGVYMGLVPTKNPFAAAFGLTNADTRDFEASLLRSAFIVERWRGGGSSLDLDLKRAQYEAKKNNKSLLDQLLSTPSKALSTASNPLLITTRMGDMAGVLFGPGGGMTFAVNMYNKFKKDGMSHEEAKTRAIEIFQIEATQSQQTTQVDNLSAAQKNAIFRMAGMYRTSQAAAAKKTMRAVNAMFDGTNKSKQEKAQIAADFVYFGIFSPMLFTAVTTGFVMTALSLTGAVGMPAIARDDEDKVLSRHTYDWLADTGQSLLQGYGYGGYIADAFLNTMRDRSYFNNVPLLKTLDNMYQGGSSLIEQGVSGAGNMAEESALGGLSITKNFDQLVELYDLMVADEKDWRRILNKTMNWQDRYLQPGYDYGKDDKLFEWLMGEEYMREVTPVKDKYKEMTYPMEGYEAESYELENYKFE